MTNVLLAAMSQKVLPLEPAPAPGRTVRATPRPRPRPVRAPDPVVAAAEDQELLPFARAVAAGWDGLEALEVGSQVAARPGFAAGDVVLVDWSACAGASLRATRHEGGVALAAGVGPTDGSGAVFAVLRRVPDADFVAPTGES